MKLKTHKVIAKRVRVTKNGKMLKIKNGRDHFNARESGNTTRSKRRGLQVNEVFARSMKTLMPGA